MTASRQGEKKTASRQALRFALGKLGFPIFHVCADVCLNPLIPSTSGFVFVSSLCCALVVSYTTLHTKAICVFRVGRGSNGLKFQAALPVAAIQTSDMNSQSLSQQQDLLNGMSPMACRQKRPCTLEVPNSLFLAGSTKVAVILNPPAGPLRRFDFDGLVTGSVLVRVLRCCEWQE